MRARSRQSTGRSAWSIVTITVAMLISIPGGADAAQPEPVGVTAMLGGETLDLSQSWGEA
jgi:hypothetical protein